MTTCKIVRSASRLIGMLALLGAPAGFSQPASVPSALAPRHGDIGLVVTYFYYAMYQGADACPQGMAHVAGSKELFARVSAQEQARLLKPENRKELALRMVQRGPHGENVCRAPWIAPDPHMPTLAGHRNDGLDLDGSADDKAHSRYTCAHTQYEGGDGTRGIDNQLGRAYACLASMREKGTLVSYFTQAMHEGMWSMLIRISRVRDRRNQANVTVDIYAGLDAMPMDATGKVLAGATLRASPEARMHRRFSARIVDGVLETRPIPDLLVPDLQARFLPPVRIERPRLRLTLLPDGTAKGILGGYIATSRLTSPQTDGDGETAKGVPCDGLWHALHNLADGARDPRTGECHAISAAFRIEALPAFIALPNSDRRH